MVFKYGENSIHCRKLQKTQKKIIRYINTKQRIAHTDSLFKNSKILKVNDLYYQLHTTLFMYDFKNYCLPESLDILVKSNQNRTRQKHNLIVNKPRTNYSVRLPKHQFVKVWNKLSTTTYKCLRVELGVS